MSIGKKLEFCRSEREGGLLFVTIDRPERMNALHWRANEELSGIFDAFEADPELWVAILTGAGDRAFCAGNDLKYQATEAKGELRAGPASGFAGLTSRFGLTKPVIAAVNGVAMGGGFEIALACDMIVAASDARWGFPEVRRGVVASSGALFRAPRSLPLHVAKELLLSGAETTTGRLEHLGVVNRMVEPGGALAAALELAREICVSSPTAVQQTLRAVDRIVGESDDFGWAATADSVRTNFASDDSAEGVAAFLEKRQPNWTGR